MLTLSKIISTLKANQDILETEYQVKSIGIFGSFALNTATEYSDIDVLVEFNDAARDIFDAKYNLRTFLQSTFSRDIDITRSKYLKPYVRDEILKSTKYVI